MSDYGEKVANIEFVEIIKKLKKLYAQAEKDLKGKLDSFVARHAAADARKRALLAEGKITQAQYRSWMRGQVFQQRQWQGKVKQIKEQINKVNEEAAEIVHDGKLGVFMESYNHEAYETERDVSGAVSFEIYNRDTVRRLVRDNPQMLPKWKIDQKKDYRWNQEKVQNAITQGIIQGESIDQITERLVKDLCAQNAQKMRTFARTAMTGAQNAGKQQQMEDSKKKGLEMQRMWVATLDNRTREAHQELDGQTVEVGEPFRLGNITIRFPGDPSAPPAMIYNCRCSMERIFKGIKTKRLRRAYEDDDGTGRRRSYIVEDMTYKEWLEWKKVHKK